MQIPVHPHALGKLEKMLYRISIEVGWSHTEQEKAHWKGAWDQQLHEATRVKNWKRKLGVCYRDEKRWIKKRKRQIKRMRRKKRNEAINALRERDPRRYWKHIQLLMGKIRNGTPSELSYKGKELRKDEVAGAW